MARELDFGNDRDEAPRGVIDHLADLLLRIEAAVGGLVVTARLVVLAAGILADERPFAHRPHAREFGVFADLDPPPLVVGQVPVEDIHLVHGHQIERALDLIDRKEMACHIEHQPAVSQRRAVVDPDRGQLHGPQPVLFECRGGQQLPERCTAWNAPSGPPARISIRSSATVSR